MEAQWNKSFPLKVSAKNVIAMLKTDITNATLAIPENSTGNIAIGAVLSQASGPIAFLSRTLLHSEQKQSRPVEREAMAIVEAARKWSQYIKHLFPTLIKMDQKAVSYIFSKEKSRIKNDKLVHWRLELSELHYDIIYRKGSENIPMCSNIFISF